MGQQKLPEPSILAYHYLTEHMTLEQIADTYLCEPDSVRETLVEYGVTMRTPAQSRMLNRTSAARAKRQTEIAINGYTKPPYKSVLMLAEEMEISISRVRRLLGKAGVQLRKPRETFNLRHNEIIKKHEDKIERINKAINSGLKGPQIAESERITLQQLHTFCSRNGIKLTKPQDTPAGIQARAERARRWHELHEGGQSIDAIAMQADRSSRYVSKMMKDHNYPVHRATHYGRVRE